MKTAIIVFSMSTLAGLLLFSLSSNNLLLKNNEFTFSTSNEPGPDQRPYEWDYIKKTYPYYNADPDVYIRALEQAHKLQKESIAKRLNKGSNAVPWEFAGPINIGGRVTDIEFDPNDPEIAYAGFSTGGVFKSLDAGDTWIPIFDDQAVLTVGDIAVDPNNSNIIYVGTGEANGGHNNFPGGGVFKSTDAGLTWNFLGLEGTTSIGRIVINPQNSNVLYLASVGSYFAPNPERGIYKSTDGGISWVNSLFISDTTGAIDIIIDPNNPERLMAATWERVRRPNSSHLFGPTSGIYKTTNGGDNWGLIKSSEILNAVQPGVGRIGLSICNSNPDIVYALFTDGYSITGFYKSTNFGISWADADPAHQLSLGSSSFSWYFGQVRVNPINPDVVYVLDVEFMMSTNGGNTWLIQNPPQLHVDHHALAFNPYDPDYIVCGNDGGINVSTDGGLTFSEPKKIPATQFYEIGLDYNNPQKLYGGTQDNGTNRTPDGNLDNWQHIFGGDGFYVIVDYNNPNIIYAESQNGELAKSTQGGSNWNYYVMNGINTAEPTNWSTPVVMDPNTSSILYYGTHSLYRTTNGATSWAKISPQLTDWVSGSRLGTITTIAVAPSNSNVIYIGTDDAHVWVTSDNGVNWVDVSAGLPQRWVTRVVVDPGNENIVYTTFSGLKWHDPQPHVYRSTNKGFTWIDISSNLPDAPVNAFAVDNNFPNRLYLGNDVGMYISFNTGQSWEVFGEGLPLLPIGDIKIHPTENFLAAGTYGRSMYKIDLNLLTDINYKNPQIANEFLLSQNYPNPFNPWTIIHYSIPNVTLSPHKIGEGSKVQLKIYDMLGNEVVTLVDKEQSEGEYNIRFDASSLSSGVYLYKLSVGNYSETKKMLFLK